MAMTFQQQLHVQPCIRRGFMTVEGCDDQVLQRLIRDVHQALFCLSSTRIS